MARILAISPHPDDESIGCGGTLRKHVLQGDEVHALFLTSGEAGGHGRSAAETRELREREAEAACEILGLHRIEFWRERDGKLCASARTVDRLFAKLVELRPALLYVTHNREEHPDHRAACRIVERAVAMLNGVRIGVRMYEVWTPLEEMNQIEDISDVIDDKLAAVRAYRSQCAVLRFDEAVQGLNRYRGEMHSWPGGAYAEVFRDLNQ
jgi:LmbE family N-acetylglucosaminyl deacetylase